MKNRLCNRAGSSNTLKVNASSLKNKAIALSAGAAAAATVMSTSLLWASGSNAFSSIAQTISDLFQQFYEAAIGIISVIAIILIFICLILRMISKDQRKVESATEWMKRIIITWVIIIFLGNIQDIFEGLSGEEVSFTSS